MNRILTADVILTLTVEQASRLLECVRYLSASSKVSRAMEFELFELLKLLRQQCEKQGVRT